MKLLQQVVFIDGLSRTGKSLFSPLISIFEGVEQINFFNYIEHLIPGVYLNEVDLNFARQSLTKMLNEKIYDNFIGRNINFREGDQTSVVNHPKYETYLARQKQIEGQEAIENLKFSNDILPFQTHDILTNASILKKLELEIKIMEILRHPIEVIDSWYRKGWGTRFLEDSRSFTLLTSADGLIVPWFARKEPEKYLASSPMDRCVMNVTFLFEKLFEEFFQYSNKLILPILFENMLVNPRNQIERISNFLKRPILNDYSNNLEKAKLPRIVDRRSRELKKIFITNLSSKENLKKLQKCIDSYYLFLNSVGL